MKSDVLDDLMQITPLVIEPGESIQWQVLRIAQLVQAQRELEPEDLRGAIAIAATTERGSPA